MNRPANNDQERIIRAVREHNAAQNAMRRANAELLATLPPDVVVLHKRSGDDRNYYWSYLKQSGRPDILQFGTESIVTAQTPALIIEAPGPRDECLPRLLPTE